MIIRIVVKREFENLLRARARLAIAVPLALLLIFGLRAEQLFRTREYLLIYVVSGLTGNLLTLLFGPEMISAGASSHSTSRRAPIRSWSRPGSGIAASV
jgi:drug/metabolite transporter (DMT)-like permease